MNLILIASAFLTLEPREYTVAEFRDLIRGRDGAVVRSADRKNPAVVTGGRKIGAWKVGADGVWRTTLEDVKAGKWYFSQLFVNGARRYRPRVPADGWYEALAPTRIEKDKDSPAFGVGGFTYAGDVLDPEWENLGDTEIQVLFQWNGARMRIREIDAAKREVVFTAVHPRLYVGHLPKNRRFAVENVKEAFGAAGRWYLDRPSGVLSYKPLPGETPENCTVEAPYEENLLVLDGARDITFRNIVFRLDNRNTPAGRSEFTSQGSIGTGAAVDVRSSSGIVFDGCVFVNLGAWALSFDDRTSNCRVSACVIADCGSGGIRIGSTEKAAERITVEDTRIYELGRRNPGGPGIMAVKAAHCRFLRNHIHHLYYTGISVGWGWCVEDVPSSHHNEIACNHIHDIGLRHLSDMGLVYLLCRQPGTRVHHNYLHDIRHWGYGSTGIYPDECSAHLEIDHNFVRGTGRSFHCNMVRDLDVHDNVFIDGDKMQWDFSSNLGEDENLVRMRRNTFVWSAGALAQRGRSFKIKPELRKTYRVPPFWSGLDLDENVYWRRDGEEAVFPAERFSSPRQKGLTLEEFRRASGLERSSVYRDPGELDPLKVCGVTGVSPQAVHAEWKMPEMPRPFGWKEQFIFRRESVEFRMSEGISTVLEKLKRGEEVTVCYFGGSITEGSSYRVPFTAWLRERYPGAKINEINAGIGGTGSDLGVYRLGHDVLRHDPDLVFVEFALNDGAVDKRRISANVEGIVRGIWKHDPETDIVFLYTVSRRLARQFGKGILSDEAAIYDLIADRYRIPTVNFAPRVLALERSGKLVWTLGDAPTAVPQDDPERKRKIGEELAGKGVLVFSNDGVHPSAEGGRLYFDTLTNFFSRPMPRPYVCRRALVNEAFFDLDPVLSPESLGLSPSWLKGSWKSVAADEPRFGRFLKRTDSMWVSGTPGDRLEFCFTGAECSLYALYGPSGARLEITVDGKDMGRRDLFDRYCTYWRPMSVPVFRGERKRHHVTIRISAEQPDRTKVFKYSKLGDEKIRTIGFDGHTAAIGRIFIDGKME